MNSQYRIELPSSSASSLRALAEEAAAWGGDWRPEGPTRGRLELPVLAGVRYGRVAGEVTVEESESGSVVTFRVDQSHYRLQKPSVLFLLLGGFGSLLCLVAPFVPALRPAIPIGILLGVAAYLFIVTKLTNSGPEEFFEELGNDSPRGSVRMDELRPAKRSKQDL